ncbi:MAG: serine/threonine-protein kinase [Rectinemataceae bacterium]|jgi:serine/threonine-protein kinase
MLQIGDQFDRFQILGHLAQGGMSDIYRAYDVVAKAEVSLKIPDQMMIGDPAQYERFQRELEITATLHHPAVLRGLGSGSYNRTPFIATEFVAGKSLRAILEEESPLSQDRALALFKRIAEGIAYCHDNNVVHRDLKPENILVRPDGQPVIIDFGLALTKKAHRVTYANLSATAGTPEYMAPEQVEGQRGDARTDIYALGIVLFEMLAGRPPYEGDNNLAVMSQHLRGNPPRLDREAAGVSPNVAAIVARCLRRDPKDRYQDVGALVDAIDHPETADLSLLERPNGSPGSAFFRSAGFKGVSIAVGLLALFVALAFLLQRIHR